MLALGTMTVLTGVVLIMVGITGVTMVKVAAHDIRLTGDDVVQRATMAREHLRTVSAFICGTVLPNDIC